MLLIKGIHRNMYIKYMLLTTFLISLIVITTHYAFVPLVTR